ncbi:hypothetical protein VaNZ11_002007 [Volvox africanus]|uniref:Sulfhydryl oxidase n=1 Tax=Volvox africanus TaxID=51714 RepID=A0ABQ5RRS4_9CHLO|nr:hypothetical protein VaNZ11_002007 [Volvox africanus]
MCVMANADAQMFGGLGPDKSSARGWAIRDSKSCRAGWASVNGTRTLGAILTPKPQHEAAAGTKEAALLSTSGWRGAHNDKKDHLVIQIPALFPLASITATFAAFLPSRTLASTTESATTATVPISHFHHPFTWFRADSYNGTASRAFHHPFASIGGASAALVPAMLPSSSFASSNTAAALDAAAAVKAEVGRATWTLLHTLAAQFPDRPTRQQQRDARTLVDCLTRIYPCGDCARHFAELVRRNPPVVSSGPAFRRWLCQTHNRVNARLGKALFNCDLVESRWAPLGCSAAEAVAGEEVEGEGGRAIAASGSRRAGVRNAGCELLGVGSKGSQKGWGGWDG